MVTIRKRRIRTILAIGILAILPACQTAPVQPVPTPTESGVLQADAGRVIGRLETFTRQVTARLKAGTIDRDTAIHYRAEEAVLRRNIEAAIASSDRTALNAASDRLDKLSAELSETKP